MTYDAVIVGAGIVGAACAAALARDGLRVVVIDKSGIAGGTTAAGMGHIVVMDDSNAQFALTSYSQELWNQLALEMGRRCEFENCGTIWVAADDEEMAEVKRKHAFYEQRGIKTEILDSRSLREAEPNLAEHLVGGLHVPGDSVVYQLTATQHLLDTAMSSGTVVKTGETVSEIREGSVRLNGGESISALNIVNAAGATAAELSPQLKIRQRKGHLVITDRYPNFVSHQLIELGYLKSAHGTDTDSVAFNVQPRITGQLLIGSSRQFCAESFGIDNYILRRMTARAFEFMPKLRGFSAIRVWTGFRPATPDNLPYIGRIPGFQNVYAAAGHEGLGITASLGTAELIADEILGRKPAIDPMPYSPSRAITEH